LNCKVFRNDLNISILGIFSYFSESPQKHLGPVWQLQWIEQDRGTTGDDKREILVSISADGRISKWVIRKGLDCHGKKKIILSVSCYMLS
jgi:hypothetical protein